MNLLILDAGHSFDTKGKNNISQNFYEWEFNNEMHNLDIHWDREWAINHELEKIEKNMM